MLILICKVIGFFQGILKGKKSEFNYHYSKKHHGTECLRLSHVCFTPLSKKQAGCRGRGAAGTPRCAPHPPSGRSRLPSRCEGPEPRVLPAAARPEGPRISGSRRPAHGVRHRVPSTAPAGCGCRGNHVSTGQAQFWKGFLSPSRFVFTKMDFQH